LVLQGQGAAGAASHAAGASGDAISQQQQEQQQLAHADDESDAVDDAHEDAVPFSEDFDDWPDAPVMLCPDPAALDQVCVQGFVARTRGWSRLLVAVTRQAAALTPAPAPCLPTAHAKGLRVAALLARPLPRAAM
jgi:hypothetical protein